MFPTATTTTTTAAVTTATTAAAAAAFFAGLGNIDGKRATTKLAAIQSVDRSLRLFGRAHRDEGKTAGATTDAVHHQIGFHHATVRGESILKIVFGDVEGKVSYEQFITHVFDVLKTKACFKTVSDCRISNHQRTEFT
jgi:hypothetical protein